MLGSSPLELAYLECSPSGASQSTLGARLDPCAKSERRTPSSRRSTGQQPTLLLWHSALKGWTATLQSTGPHVPLTWSVLACDVCSTGCTHTTYATGQARELLNLLTFLQAADPSGNAMLWAL